MVTEFTFHKLKFNDLKSQLRIRNQKSIREASFNKNKIHENEHKKWFDKLSKSEGFHYYVLKHNDVMVGVGYGKDYKKKDKSYLWGFYVDSTIKSDIKYGSIIKYYILKILFEEKNVESLRCEVLFGNEWIRDWHERWGHQVTLVDNEKKYYELYLKKEVWQHICKQKYNYLSKYLSETSLDNSYHNK